ncbi:hypothetical protein H0H87_007456 [Tephrocybe sp. NHM501043]|nr:hypothetical protein H0H87_007456 [Tephrocybe sp. NHM501043]
MDTKELQQVARHIHRLESNWNLEKPRLSRAVGYVHFPDNLHAGSIIAPIPGTSLVVLYGLELDEDWLVVCDGEGTSPLVRFRIGIPVYKAVSIEPGRLFIALVTEVFDVDSKLQVFSISYGAEKTPSIAECFSSRLQVNPNTVGVLFIATNTVGVVGRRAGGESYSLHIINFARNLSITVPMPFKGMFASKENPDLEAIATEISANIVRVARFLRSHSGDTAFETVEGMLSSRGFTLIPTTDYNHPPTRMFFWPIADIHSLVEDTIMIPATTSTMEGRIICHWNNNTLSWPLLPSRSGAYWIAIVRPDGYKEPELRLIRWDPDPPAIRTLDVRSYIDLGNISDIFIEESYGVIYLFHAHGDLVALSYA